VGLTRVIANLDEYSAVSRYAFGRVQLPAGYHDSEVVVGKTWHQKDWPHFTVFLRLLGRGDK
jgi:hypothetical protein